MPPKWTKIVPNNKSAVTLHVIKELMCHIMKRMSFWIDKFTFVTYSLKQNNMIMIFGPITELWEIVTDMRCICHMHCNDKEYNMDICITVIKTATS